MKHLFYHCFTIIIFLMGCKKDPLYISDSNVQFHYESFLYEAKKRGVKLNLKKLNAIVIQGKNSQIADNGLPSAGYYNHTDKTIYLDSTSWPYKHNLEVLIFHELGHALLGRDHCNELFNAQNPKSIMNGKFNPEYQYQMYKREYYINELFNENEPRPYWAP